MSRGGPAPNPNPKASLLDSLAIGLSSGNSNPNPYPDLLSSLAIGRVDGGAEDARTHARTHARTLARTLARTHLLDGRAVGLVERRAEDAGLGGLLGWHLPPEGFTGFIMGGAAARGIHRIHNGRGCRQRDSQDA